MMIMVFGLYIYDMLNILNAATGGRMIQMVITYSYICICICKKHTLHYLCMGATNSLTQLSTKCCVCQCACQLHCIVANHL